MQRLVRIIALSVLAVWSVRADISCPADSTCITCSGDITTALTNALNGENRVVLSSGSCSFSSQQTADGDTQIVGSGSDLTTLTYTGAASPAFNGCASDSAAQFHYGFKLVLQNAVEGYCIEGFSNTSTMRDVHIDGGTVGVRLEQSAADQSTAWVGSMVDMEFSNQSSHAIVLETGNQNLAILRPTFTSCGDDCLSLENPTHFHSSVQVIGGSCAPDAGFSCVECLGCGGSDRNTPLTMADVSWTPADTNQDFVFANNDKAAVTLIDIEHDSCAAGNLLLDKPTAGNDVACDGANQKKILPRSDGLADVSNMTAQELSDFQAWLDTYVYAPLNIALQSFTSGYTEAANCACSGNIESCIEDAWAAGDLTVYVGTGGNSSTACTVGQLNFVTGARLVGRGNGRTGGGAGEGTWINATGAGPGFVMNDIDDWQVTGIKLGHTNSAQDVVEVTDFCDDCLMSRIDTRNGDSHIVFEENGSGVAAHGGLIMAWLSFNHSSPIYQVNSTNGQFRHSVITPDIGRGSGDQYDINDVDPTTSSWLRMGGIQQMGSSGPNIVNISSSGALPVLDLGGMPPSIGSGETVYLADSDISITLLGLGYTTNPATPIEADFLLNESGTADDIDPASAADYFIISKFDELVTPAGAGDSTPPTPGNSGTITTDQVTSSGFRANWTKGTDDSSAQGALQYRVYRSSTNNIGTVADAKANGTLELDWTTDIATHTLTGLDPSTTYWVNVLIRDEALNEAAYTQTSETTSATASGFAIRTQRYSLPTSIGAVEYTISGIGTPKAAMVVYVRADTNATAKDDASMGIGFTDGTRERSASFFSNHGHFAEDPESQSENKIIYVRDQDGTVIQDATFSQWVTDGIELTHNTVDGSNADFIHITFFVGASLSAHVNTVSLAGQDTAVDVTDPGFEPNQILFTTIGRTTHPATEADAHFSFGVADNTGAAFDQFSWAYREKQNISVGQPVGVIDDRYAAGNIDINNGVYAGAIEVSSPDSQGFTATGRTANTTDQKYFYLALDYPAGVDHWAGQIDTRTSPGSQSYTGPGFQPQYVGWGLTHLEALQTVISSDDAGSNGLGFADGTREYACTFQQESASASTDCQSYSENVIAVAPLDNGGTGFRATFTSFDPSGWTVNFTSATGVAKKTFAWAVGEAPAPAGPSVEITGAVLEGVTF